MTNPITLEQYAIKRIEELEGAAQSLAEDVESWKTLYNREHQALDLLAGTIASIGHHEYSDIYRCNVVRLDNVQKCYDAHNYEVLAKYLAPVEGAPNDEEPEAETSEA